MKSVLQLLIAWCCLGSVWGEAEESVADLKREDLLRLMTFNVHHCEGMDGKTDIARVAKAINSWRVDLVAVQEVDVETERSSGVDQAAELARLTGMHYAFGKFMDFRGGDYGQMVLSKFPIKQVRNLALPDGPEPRTALVIDVEVPRGEGVEKLVFVGLHFYATEAERTAQAEALVVLLADELQAQVPIILAGDFNSTPGSRPMGLLGQHWIDPTAEVDRRTWPSDVPKVEIDYILYRPESRFKFVKSRPIVDKVTSDHRPVLTVLEWADRE